MTLAELKKLMPDATDDQLKAALEAMNTDTKTQIEAETSGLLENKTKLLDQMTKLKKNQVPEDFDAEAYATYNTEKAEFTKKQKELADKELEGKGQWDALKMQLNDTHKKAIGDLTDSTSGEITSLRKALDKELIENNLIKAIEAEKGNSLFLLPHMRGQMKTVQNEDGSYGVQVFDEKGNQRFLDDATTPFEAKDLVAEFKANDAYVLAFPDLNAGSGGDPDTGGKGGTGINPWKDDTKNITEQARINKENPTLATQMKKAAGQ